MGYEDGRRCRGRGKGKGSGRDKKLKGRFFLVDGRVSKSHGTQSTNSISRVKNHSKEQEKKAEVGRGRREGWG